MKFKCVKVLLEHSHILSSIAYGCFPAMEDKVVNHKKMAKPKIFAINPLYK